MAKLPTFGDFVLGLEGLAILRSWMTDPTTVKARSKKIVEIAGQLDEAPWAAPIAGIDSTVAIGYSEWAETYDEPGNPAILAEEPVVRRLFATRPVGEALDAACGTGRHAEYLASMGHSVIGIDANDEMLAVAKAKVPVARFETGDLTSIPLENSAVDLVACSLSLTHCPDLGPPIKEIGRVLRSDGTAIISDVHPFVVMLGGHAKYPRNPPETGFVVNYVHLVSDYLNAFQEAGLDVVNCTELLHGGAEIATMAFAKQMPDLMEAAVKGVPIVIVWELVKKS